MDSFLKSIILESYGNEPHHKSNSYELADIFIKDGVIEKIDRTAISAFDISSEHFFVTSGFVNSHLHPNQLLDRRMLDELSITNLLSAMHIVQKKNDEDRYHQAIFVLLDALKSGATSVYAIASRPEPVIRAFNDIGIIGALNCVFNDVWEGKGNVPAQISLEDVEKQFSRYFESNCENLKIHIGSASILTASNELLTLFNDIAIRYNTRVNIHMSEGIESVEACRKNRGTSPVRLLENLGILNERWNLIHATTVDEEEIKLIARSGASIIHCPVSNAKTGVGIAPMLEFHKNGVNIAIGTDACSNNNTNNILNEAYFATLLHNGVHKNPLVFSEEIIFDWLTTNGLKIIDSPSSGKIEVGQRADLLLWSLKDPCFVPLPYGKLRSVLINNAPDAKPHTVMLAGKKIIENYICTNDLEKIATGAINAWARRGLYNEAPSDFIP
jgi:5-methylthioadenosine/S-adenosylhomocysteine deaminase